MLKRNCDLSDRRELAKAFAALRAADDAAAFLADLCTPAEIDEMAGRWKVARLLDRGLTYRAIAERTGISTATVTRVARCLTYGTDGGYRRALGKEKKP